MKSRSFAFAAIVTVAAFLVEVAILVLYRETWFDELLYSFKGMVIASGTFVPFADIIVEYPPLFIPVYGIPQLIFGPSLVIARLVSGTLTAALLWATFIVGRKLGGKWWGLAAVWFLMSNVLVMGNYVSGTLFAITALFLVLSVWIETLTISRSKRAVFTGITLGLMMLTRINMLPAVIVYAAYYAYIRIGWRPIGIFAVTFLAVVALGYAPIVIANPELAIAHIVRPFAQVGILASLPGTAVAGGQSGVEYVKVFAEVVREYFPYLLFFVSAMIVVIRIECMRFRSFVKENNPLVLLATLGIGLFAAHYFYWGVIGQVAYLAYFLPIIVLVYTVGFSAFGGAYRPFMAIALAVAIVLNLGANVYRTDVISDPRVESDLARVARGAILLEREVPEGVPVLAFDNSIFHVFSSGRSIPQAALINRDFFYVSSLETERARELRFYNFELLRGWLAEAQFVALNRENWNQQFVRGSFWGPVDPDGAQKASEIRAILDSQFELVGVEENVYPRKYTKGNDGGTLELYRRRDRENN